MLDTDTKRRINTCRDILVGKVPDPKSQVEQITIALIYKFMDDMDLEAEEMQFERKFFTGEFERYRWSKLVAPGVGGQEMLNLYTEALTKMVENADLPELFRAIFRNAFLPYRDPETLRSFLREIDGFTYDHSERLGDAFEYLLSVLGSQGDAGQFRTPRHIIDFMVEIIDPKKDEVILDPACGTAGFLISSYKHILKTNTTAPAGNGGQSAEVDAAEATLDSPLRYAGDLLSTDDRQRLANNIRGYDISPDMVRLSLVNLYLHGFLDPKVEEYDTLSSEDKWGDTADVILANPPFMSPKGGIRPHNRFQVQSKRSEVLFVDYIAEHLNPNGRAAIVVPEGIIFQSQSAYVALRKMLVDKFLAAVISLPAGVFNPYSGVKTSILILDRAVAKASESVPFFKVENDGFGLGAQRRAVKGGQLPQVKAELGAWLAAVRGGGEAVLESFVGFAVEKERIAESGEYNLSGERYREKAATHSAWPMFSIGSLCDFRSGLWKGKRPPFTSAKILRNTNFGKDGRLKLDDIAEHEVEVGQLASRILEAGDLLLERSGGGPTQPVGRVAYFDRTDQSYSFSNFTSRLRPDRDLVEPEYFWRILHALYGSGATEQLQKQTSGIRNLDNNAYKELEIPLPPLEVQREIVAEIEGYQKVIDGARAVLANYRPHIPIGPAWPIVELSELCQLISGQHIDKDDYNREKRGIGYLTGPDDFGEVSPSVSKWTEKPKITAREGDILITVKGSGLGKINLLNLPEVAISRQLMAIRVENAKSSYIFAWIRGKYDHIQSLGAGAAIPGITRDDVLKLKIPLPPLETQQAIVAEIEAEQALVDANRELIDRFEKKIAVAINRVWGSSESQAKAEPAMEAA